MVEVEAAEDFMMQNMGEEKSGSPMTSKSAQIVIV